MKLPGCLIMASCFAVVGVTSLRLCAADPVAGEATRPSAELRLAALLADPRDGSAALAEQRAALNEVLVKAVEPLDQAEAELALANWLLAIPTAPPAMRLLLDVASPDDCKALAQAAAEAREHLKKADRLVRAAREDGSAAPPAPGTQPATATATASSPADQALREDLADRLRIVEKSRDHLEALAEVLAAPGVEGDQETQQAAWSRAARALARMREAARDEVAAGATLWQAFAWQKAGRIERARASLPEVLLPPGDSPYMFLLRILRDKLLADQEQFAAASVLAMKMRQSCPAWFPNEPPAEVAARQRLVALVEVQIGQAWARQLEQAADSDNAARLRELLDKIKKTVFPDGVDTGPVYRLPSAVPMLAAPLERLESSAG